MRGIALFALLATLPAGTAFAQPDWDAAEVKVTPVAGGVYMLSTDFGGNIGASVGEDGVLLIDDQFAPLADKIRAALRGIGEGKVMFVLNTHFHGDHTGGNPEFGREAVIVAHKNVRGRRAVDQDFGGGRRVEALPKEGLPVITFEDSLTVHFNGEDIRAIALPKGHTDGDVAVFFPKANVLHTGDQYFAGRFPFVDLDGGGDVDGYIANVAALLARLPDDAKVIPGHGPLSDKRGLREFHTMLVETVAHVRRGIQAGRSLEQLQSAGLPARWKDWSWQFIDEKRWIATLHRSYSRKP